MAGQLGEDGGAGDEGGGDSSSGPAHLLLGRFLARRSYGGGLRVPGGPVEPVELGAVAASWGAFGSIPGSPEFSSFPAPLTLTVGARRCPQVLTLRLRRFDW